MKARLMSILPIAMLGIAAIAHSQAETAKQPTWGAWRYVAGKNHGATFLNDTGGKSYRIIRTDIVGDPDMTLLVHDNQISVDTRGRDGHWRSSVEKRLGRLNAQINMILNR